MDDLYKNYPQHKPMPHPGTQQPVRYVVDRCACTVQPVVVEINDPPTPPTIDAHYTDAAQLAAWRQERG